MERENGEVTRLTVVVAYSSIEAIADGVVDDPPKTQKKESSRTIKRLCSQFASADERVQRAQPTP